MDKSQTGAGGPSAGPAHWADQITALGRAVDPFGIGAAFSDVAQGWLANPNRLASSLADFTRDVQAMQLSAWQAALGLQPTPVVRSAPDDARFADAAWTEQPAFALLKNYYLLYTHWLQEALFETPGVNTKVRRQATFWARQWLNAMAPSNFLLTNPVALSKAFDTGGKSLADNIRVVGINPGPVGTDRHVAQMKARAARELGDETRYRDLQAKLPLARPAHPREIADLMIFLASDRSAYTSGVVVTVDGGFSAGWGG